MSVIPLRRSRCRLYSGRSLPVRKAGGLLMLTLVAALASCAHTATTNPVASSTRASTAVAPTPMWFASLQMVSPKRGWALRWARTPGGAGALLAVSRTTDGGHTWTDVTPAQAGAVLGSIDTVGCLYAFDAERAWFAVSRPQQDRYVRMTVYRTADGGRRWSSSTPIDSHGTPEYLDFVEASHGWLLADLGAATGNDVVALFATVDGGRRWTLASETASLVAPTQRPKALPLEGTKTGLRFVSPTTGWVTADNIGGGAHVEITHDGGRTWAAQSLPIPQGARFTAGSEVSPPQFFDRSGFLVLLGSSKPILLLSHDGGTIWARETLPAGAGRFPVVQFVDARHCFLVEGSTSGALGPRFYRTTDGGRTWNEVHTTLRFSQLQRSSFDFVTPHVGFAWVAGDDEQGATAPPLYETSDGGQTWNRIVPQVGLRP